MRLVAARTLAWALLIGGWLVLGALGQTLSPRWAGGLAPVALWLGAAGFTLHVGRSALLSSAHLRRLVGGAGLASAAAVAWAGNGGGVAALSSAAIAWGVLLVAASRSVRMMRGCTHHRPPPVVPAVAGAALAWLVAGDPTAGPTFGAALGLACATALLAALLPPRGAGRGCRAGLFDCALPLESWSHWCDPAAWSAQSARWAMLPMMASLAAMTQWCGDLGLAPSQAAGLHLCAMLLPALALHRLHVRLKTDAGAAVAMIGGLAGAYLLPGLQGLMAASMCHSLAWGLVWFSRVSGPTARCASTTASTWTSALLPSCCALALGFAIATDGPMALRWVHIGLGMVAAVGGTLSLWRSSSLRLEKSS